MAPQTPGAGSFSMRHRQLSGYDSNGATDPGDKFVLLGPMCNGARQGRIRTNALVITRDGLERVYDCKLDDFVRQVWPDEENVDRRCKDLRFLGDMSKRDFLVKEYARWILVRADFCRALIEEDMVVFLFPGGETFERFKDELMQEIGQRSQDIDFHKWATECIICANVAVHTLRFQVLRSVISRFLDQVNTRGTDAAIMRLFPLKIALSKFIEQVKPLVSCLQELVQSLESRNDTQLCGQKKMSTAGSPSVKSSIVADEGAPGDAISQATSQPMLLGTSTDTEDGSVQPKFKNESMIATLVPPSLSSIRRIDGSKFAVPSLTSSSSSDSSAVVAGFEDMLRTWRNNTNEVLADAEELSEHITEALRFTEVSGNYLRNRLLRLELFATVVGLVMAFGAVVTGVFGMNLTTGIENTPYMFNIAVCGIVLVGLSIVYFSLWWYRRTLRAHHTQSAMFGNNLFFRNVADDNYVLSLGVCSGDGTLDHDSRERIFRDLETVPSSVATLGSVHTPPGCADTAALNVSQFR